jgi:CheY-like chemotaxis protein
MMAGLNEIRVLIIDDNAQMRGLIRSVLRGAGITRVSEAGTVEEGLTALRLLPPDVVLLDLAMKPFDGIEFAVRARNFQRSPNPYVAIIMMTCHAQPSRVATARDAGVNSFLAKPITGRSLIEHILAVINDARPFVRCDLYFGPDRRRMAMRDYPGPWRRAGESGGDGLDLDEDFGPEARSA